MTLGVRRGGEEVIERPAGAVPLRGQHLQRRKANRAAGRAAHCRCGCRRRSRLCRSASRESTTATPSAPASAHPRRGARRGAGRGRQRSAVPAATDARGSGDGRQRCARPAESVVKLRAAAGLDRLTGRADGHVLARGRIADGAVPGAVRAMAPPPASITIRAAATSAGSDSAAGTR